jgi:hypothetical protein
MAILANSDDDDFGDMLIQSAIEFWKDMGNSDDDIISLIEIALEEQEEDAGG